MNWLGESITRNVTEGLTVKNHFIGSGPTVRFRIKLIRGLRLRDLDENVLIDISQAVRSLWFLLGCMLKAITERVRVWRDCVPLDRHIYWVEERIWAKYYTPWAGARSQQNTNWNRDRARFATVNQRGKKPNIAQSVTLSITSRSRIQFSDHYFTSTTKKWPLVLISQVLTFYSTYKRPYYTVKSVHMCTVGLMMYRQ